MSEPNGRLFDEHGMCRVCGGEIPDGHTPWCDFWIMEKDRKRLTLLCLSRAEKIKQIGEICALHITSMEAK